jgi:hypothetical protein
MASEGKLILALAVFGAAPKMAFTCFHKKPFLGADRATGPSLIGFDRQITLLSTKP